MITVDLQAESFTDLPNEYEAKVTDFESVGRIVNLAKRKNIHETAFVNVVVKWFTALEIFRNIELNHTRERVDGHQSSLEALIDLGRDIVLASKGMDLSACGYSNGTIRANYEYLLSCWEIWYSPRDEERANKFLSLVYGESKRSL